MLANRHVMEIPPGAILSTISLQSEERASFNTSRSLRTTSKRAEERHLPQLRTSAITFNLFQVIMQSAFQLSWN